jgi:hypothetical protein
MRPYRNITDEELSALGAIREWSADRARELPLKSELLWVHNRRKKLSALQGDNDALIRRVTVLDITNRDIITNFGRYAVETGRNVHKAYYMQYFDCYGRLYLLDSNLQNTLLNREIPCTTSSTSV